MGVNHEEKLDDRPFNTHLSLPFLKFMSEVNLLDFSFDGVLSPGEIIDSKTMVKCSSNSI